MRFDVVGKNGFEITKSIESYAIDKISKIKQYITDSENLDCRIVCKVYNDGHKVEVTIPLKNIILRSEVVETDMYKAIDSSVSKLETQIRKQKTKTNKILQQREGIANFFKDDTDMKALSKELEAQKLVKTKSLKLNAMSKEEAINQMEMLGHDFFVYLDDKTNKTHIIYLRDDYDYAVIETTI